MTTDAADFVDLAPRVRRKGFVASRHRGSDHRSLDAWSRAARHVDVDATHIGIVGYPGVLRRIAVAFAMER